MVSKASEGRAARSGSGNGRVGSPQGGWGRGNSPGTTTRRSGRCLMLLSAKQACAASVTLGALPSGPTCHRNTPDIISAHTTQVSGSPVCRNCLGLHPRLRRAAEARPNQIAVRGHSSHSRPPPIYFLSISHQACAHLASTHLASRWVPNAGTIKSN